AATSGAALLRLVQHERIDLVIPSSDSDVTALSAVRDELGPRCFLPAQQVIDLCQDKFELTQFLAARGIPLPASCAVTRLGVADDTDDLPMPFDGQIEAVFEQLDLGFPSDERAHLRVEGRALGWA